jgi:hypothetical protein
MFRRQLVRIALLIPLLLNAAIAYCAERGAPRQFALLVGCTKYDNNKLFRLVGPGNDVELLRTVLAEKFKFPAENIVVLSDKVGGRFRPTYENIAREFAELAKKAEAGDEVVILLGGHGSQQPEQDPPDRRYPKPNGRDQIFLPADIGVWDGGKQHKVVNSIADYELRKWTKAITATGASLWLIVDSCCSGETLRGGEVARKMPTEELGIPAAAFAEAARRARARGATRGGSQPELLFDLAEQSPNFVALYAARPDEPTVERPLPLDDDNAKTHGLLTYTVCEILARSDGHLDYLDLHRLICDRYSQMGRTTGPKPLIEGLARNVKVLVPAREMPTRAGDGPALPWFYLSPTAEGDWKLSGGRLQGLTAGSVLAVHSPRDGQVVGKPLGHVRVRQANMLDAEVSPCEYAGQPAPADDQLVPGAPCELVYRDYGSMQLRITFDKLASAGSPPVASEIAMRLDELERDLRKLSGKSDAQFIIVGRNERPDWVVQDRGGQIVFVSADAAGIEGSLPDRTPRFVIPRRSAAAVLNRYIGHVFRARNLLSLTSPGAQLHSPSRDEHGLAIDASAIDIEVEMLKLRDESDTVGTTIRPEGREIVVPAGQWVAWRVKNHSHFKVDVTLLFIDSEFNIVSAFPRAGAAADNTVTPGGQVLTGQATTTPTTFDLDRMVVIAVKSDGQPIDFSVLEQTTLAAGRGALRGAGDPTLDSPLGRLCQNALYGAGGTRGLDLKVSTHALSLISWRVK